MFNSFVDGTKSGIEMTAVCNATGLVPQTEGLSFSAGDARFELADVCKPKERAAPSEKEGVTEVTSSVTRDGRDVPHHLALGTYVVIEGETDYARRCFKEYAMLPDRSGVRRAVPADPHDRARARHLGRERGAAAGADRRADGLSPDVAATAKRSRKRASAGRRRRLLRLGQADAGGTVARPGYFPLGLAQNVKLKRDIAEGERLKWSDVEVDPNDRAVRVRREMEAAFGRPNV